MITLEMSKAGRSIQDLLDKFRNKPDTKFLQAIILYDCLLCCESPIEELFLEKAFFHLLGILPQIQLNKYRADFGILGTNILVEIDGHDYHKTKSQRTRDAKRERDLELEGWKIIRFTGTEVYKNPEKCIEETLEIIKLYYFDVGIGIKDDE